MRSYREPTRTGLSTTALLRADDFAGISDQLSELRRLSGAGDDLHTHPDYFLACTDPVRRSRTVACWRGERLAGLLYVFEHCVAGIPTGYALAGDYSGRGALLALPGSEREVVAAAVDHLMRSGIHCLHLRVSPGLGPNLQLGSRRNVQLHDIVPGDRLPLAPDFEGFLHGLGRHTRRNIRAYTRRALGGGHWFDPAVPEAEYIDAVRRLSLAAEFPIARRRLARDLRLMHLYEGHRYALRDRDGNIVAVLCGFSEGGRFYLLSQVNDSRLAALSLSLVLRGKAIEHLIASGHRELQFMGGTSLAIGRFCERLNYSGYFIDRPHWLFSPLKRTAALAVELLAGLKRRVPATLEQFAGSYLGTDRLASHTPLSPAAVVHLEELVRSPKIAPGRLSATATPAGPRQAA